MLIQTNEILYRIKKALNLSEKDILKLYKLEEYDMSESHLEKLLFKQQDNNFVICSYEELGIFLDGLISLKRGKNTNSNKSDNVELTNNLILKKLRIALKFKESETEIVFGLGEVTLSKQQLASLFRKENHKNFKPCSDELLFAFLDGLDEFYFVGSNEEE